MSVRVTDTSGALWTIAGDECGHTGEADPSTLRYGQNIDGSPNREVVLIPCPEPGCATASYWPRETVADDVKAKLPA